MIRYSSKIILGLISFISIFGGCRTSAPSEQGGIMFSVVGSQPFSDSVFTINVDGSHHRSFLTPRLTPSRSESYMYASGYSSKGPFLVVAHKEIPNNKVEDQLCVYHPQTQEWAAIQTGEGSVGRGVFSPDSSNVVFAFAPGRTAFYKLYTKKLQDEQAVRLTTSREESETEGYASWRPDGQEVVFVSLHVSSGHLVSKLLRVPATGGGNPIVVLADDNPGGAIYSPNGQTLFALTNKGIEELDFRGTRRLILDRRQVPDAGFRYGCITWCAGPELIAFATMNKKKDSEVWTVSPSGQRPKKIYTVRNGSIEGLFFLTP